MSLEGARGTKTAESREFFGVHPHLVSLCEVLLNVLLAFVTKEGNDRLQLGVGRPDFFGADQVSSAARPDEEAVLLGQAAHALDRLLRVDREGRVDQLPVALEDAWYEAVGDSLYEMLPHLPAQYGRRLRGLHGKELDMGVGRAKGLPHAYEGAAGAHAHDERVGDYSFRELAQDLGSQNLAVLLDVPLRLEL